jgi:ABC-type sugar transport system ATPase subunit
MVSATPADPPVLWASGIAKSFGGIRALTGVDIQVRAGEVLALVGANGAGKSTLINVLTGGEQPDAGEIRIGSQSFGAGGNDDLTPIRASSLGIAVIHQEFSLIPDLSVAENVFLGRLPTRRFGFVDSRRVVDDAQTILDGLGTAIDARAKVRDLSIAHQQLVEVARALAVDARILLMDEPSAVLGGRSLELLFEAVTRLRDQGVAIVYISHRLDEVFAIADRVMVMRDGLVVGTGPVSSFTKDDLVHLTVGRSVSTHERRHAANPGETLMKVSDLRTPDGGITGISFELRAGEILGLGGFVGSGRTRLLRALFGVIPSTGHVEVCGKGIPRSPRDAVAKGVAMTPEDRKAHGLHLSKSARFNISLAALTRLSRVGLVHRRDERDLAIRMVERLDVRSAGVGQTVGQLSGGNQQKIVLAKWLATSPCVLLMDEPTRGIDIAAKSEVFRLIRELAEHGMGIIVVSSEIPELLVIADRVLVMCDGRIAGELSAEEATEERILRLATTDSDSLPSIA